MGKEFINNAYIDITNLEISFTADWEGCLNISAGYCDIESPNNYVTLVNDTLLIKMQAGETIKMRNTIGLKELTFNSINEEDTEN